MGTTSLPIKQLNKEAEQATAVSNRERSNNEAMPNFQPDLLSKCMQEVVRSPKIREMIARLKDATRVEDLEDVGGEVQLRYMLESTLLVVGNGQRGDTITSMTVGELKDGRKSNGVTVVKVAHHKTMRTYGSANVSFAMPGLWKATKKYIQLYR